MEQNDTGKINIKLWFERQKKKSVEIVKKLRQDNVSVDEEAAFWAFMIMDSALGLNLTAKQKDQITKYLNDTEFEKAAEYLWKIYNKEE